MPGRRRNFCASNSSDRAAFRAGTAAAIRVGDWIELRRRGRFGCGARVWGAIRLLSHAIPGWKDAI